MSHETDLTAWQALTDTDAAELLTGVNTAARPTDTPEIVSDAVLLAARLLMDGNHGRAARTALRQARAEHGQRVARSTERGTAATVLSLDAALEAMGEELEAMSMGRLPQGGTDPASTYAYRVADVAVAMVDTLTYEARMDAAKWLDAERAGRRGKRTTPSARVDVTERQALKDALTLMGDPSPLAPAHPKHGRANHGGHQTTSTHPDHVGPVTVRTPDGKVTTRDLTQAEYDAAHPMRERLSTYEGEGNRQADGTYTREDTGSTAPYSGRLLRDGSQRSASDFHPAGVAARLADGGVAAGAVSPSPRKRASTGGTGPTIRA